MKSIHFFFFSLKGQLILGVILLHAMLMSLFVVDFINQERHFLHEQSLSQKKGLVSLVASNATLPLMNNDLVALDELITQVEHLPDVQMIFIIDNHSRIRASNQEVANNQKFADPQSLALETLLAQSNSPIAQRVHNNLLDTGHILAVGGKTIGYVRIISSTQTVRDQMRLLWYRGLFYIFIATILGGIIAWLIVRKFTARITLLSDAAEQITHQNYNINLPPFRGKDELSQMGRAFGLMIDSIHQQMETLSYEILQRKNAESRLFHKAHHDELTQLANRALFMDRLEHALHHAKRNQTQLAVLFIDLDRFKEINDTFGHEMGDCILIAIAHRLQENVRQADTIARLGGDEFTIIIEDIETISHVSAVAEKLVNALQAPIITSAQEFFVTCSIGISLYPNDGEEIQSLLHRADCAMYQAKEEGRNGYHYCT